jgi:acyl transferase domain-containing protein/NAD(P)-dependent dehydrogenase (short-subunit alcohol dehydrogenase family)
MGLDKQEIWSQLENLNVGRLRIAAKGVERQGEKLIGVGEEEQLTSGMYMIGQVVALKDRVLTMRELHGDVGEGSAGLIREAEMPERMSAGGVGSGAGGPGAAVQDAGDVGGALRGFGEKPLNVAVIGMACIYPGARNIDEYWRNIILGKDCVTEVPDERWNKEIYYDPQSTNGEKSPSKWGGFIPKIDFDPMDFGIPPQSLAAIEPSQLLSLLVARQALENAGYAGPEANKENVSVIIGAEGGNDLSNNYGFRCLFRQVFGEMPEEVDQALPRLTEDSFPGVLANVIAGRITNRLDLGGRNYTVDAACASSLAAIDLACQELILEKSDMVIAGAVDLHNSINDYLLFSSTHALSRKGRCLTFDAGADGIALGEGVAMLVLKREEDAKRDGDTIYAVIKGVGGSSDGKSLGLTAPRKAGQESALSRAYQQAGLSPSRVGLIEAHGTGTVVGDRTELSALTDLMTLSGALPGQVHLGSVKTQIGHTKCAAGMAGMIKAILSVYHGIKPPTLHLRQPNSYYRPGTSPFAFRAEAALWSDTSRVAGVSAFGFGGTNFHAVLENSGQAAVHGPVLNAWPAELFVFRGNDYEEAMQLVRTIREILLNNDSIAARDLAYSLVVHSDLPVQLSIVAGDMEDLLPKMDMALKGTAADGIYPLKPVAGKTALLFPGQGSQHINMARELFVLFPATRVLLRAYPGYERVLFPDAAFDEPTLKEQKEKIRDTRVAQPLLGMVDHAIAGLLREWGIVADMVAGHSYGELPALCYAGVIREEDLVDLSEKRAGAILAAVGADRGAMVAVNLAPGGLAGAGLPGDLAPAGSGVYVVNHNSPRQWVLAGGSGAIAELIERMKEKKISFRPLEVACAFHSPLLAGARDLFLAALQGVELNEATVPVWSNTTAGEYPLAVDAIRERLADHLVQPVKFSEEIEKMYEQGARVFVEVGPGKVLSGLTRDILDRDELVLHTGEKAGLFQLLCVAGAYMASGRAVRLEKLFDGREVKRLDLGEPARFSKSATMWSINGQMAVPVRGVLPAHGAMPVVKPLNLLHRAEAVMLPVAPAVGAERVMEEYLKNMQVMIQAQRDVLLGYLGQAQPVRMPIPALVEGELVAASMKAGAVPGAEALAVVGAVPVVERVLGYAGNGAAGQRSVPGEGEVKAILLKIVSDKTGYPPDMLDLNLDMEADLSIDSIKRMEIIAALKTGLGDWPMGAGRPGEDNNEDLTEQMASIKTLQGLIDWIARSVMGSAGPVEEAKKIIEEGFVHRDGEDKLLRLRFEWTPSVISRLEPDALRGSHFAITDDEGEGAVAIRHWLEKHGAGATIISERDPLEAYDGLILLDLLASPRRCHLLESFSLVKKLDMARVRWIYVVSDLNNHLRDKADPAEFRHFQGYGGFLKSLDKEFEHIRCRTINLDMEISPERMAGLVVDELLHADNQPEVNYEEEHRKTMRLVPSELTIGHPADIRLDAQSVVLVLGGAQGITAELMMRFSREYPCHYILVGRSPDPRKREAMLVTGGATTTGVLLKTREAIREFLIEQGHHRNPAEIEKRVDELYKQHQILHTITSLENNGARVDYHSLDCRDEDKLGRLVVEIYKTHGRIDGVVHGAGLLEDKLFRHKTPESFERVYSTKVNPLRVLADLLKADTQFVVLFSSVASVYGNRGQTDYAAANSVMDRYARELKKKISGKVMAINWGPWKGAGMVSPALEREYERRGISLIPLSQGMEFFLNELKYGHESQVLIMAGKTI